MTDIVERLRIANSNFYDEAADEIESLRQQITHSEIAANAEAKYADELHQQLAECQEGTNFHFKQNLETLERLAECQARYAQLSNRVVGVGEIAINSISRDRVDAMLKQVKREALLEAAEYCDNQWQWSENEYQQYEVDVGDGIRRMAEEL